MRNYKVFGDKKLENAKSNQNGPFWLLERKEKLKT